MMTLLTLIISKHSNLEKDGDDLNPLLLWLFQFFSPKYKKKRVDQSPVNYQKYDETVFVLRQKNGKISWKIWDRINNIKINPYDINRLTYCTSAFL